MGATDWRISELEHERMAQPEKFEQGHGVNTGVEKAADVDDKTIFVGTSAKKREVLTLGFGTRHGLVTGATGTGKTVTLQVLAEGFSNAGVSVFAADIKGDLSGVAAAGEAKPALVERASKFGVHYQPDPFPV